MTYLHQDLRWAMVVSAYLNAEISLAKAAELLGVHALELRDRFNRLGIPLRLGPVNIDEAKAEAAAALNWFSTQAKAPTS